MKKQVRVSASSSRAVSTLTSGFGQNTPSFGSRSSRLSYLAEPPDLGLITDANVIVSFKNLTKKDSTTKAKALEEILSLVSAGSEIEEGILTAWVELFPRTSIDNSRRVRQLSHTVQGQLFHVSGRRAAKFMPIVVTPWLAGLYDSDKVVSRIAHDSLLKVFPSVEKMQAIRKVYQRPILEQCNDIIENEKAETLSDERTVSPDDSEAKYSRVLAAFLGVLRSTITELESGNLSKEQSLYRDIFANKKTWELCYYKDAAVRNSTNRLLVTCVDKTPDLISENLDRISKDFIYHATSTEQSGSTTSLLEALKVLTITFPTVWTDHYSGKKTVQHRLQQFFSKGSQYSQVKYWTSLLELTKLLPSSVLPTNKSDLMDLLVALHKGISRKEELRYNLGSAYLTYIGMTDYLSLNLDKEDRISILKDMLIPLVGQYIDPSIETEKWTLPNNFGPQVGAKIITIADVSTFVDPMWRHWSMLLTEKIEASSPEQPKDFDKSQGQTVNACKRWVALQREIIKIPHTNEINELLLSASRALISEALKVLISQNGKPYCAAELLLSYLQNCPDLILKDEKLRRALFDFFENEMQSLLFSTSASRLTTSLYLLIHEKFFGQLWRKSVRTILSAARSHAEKLDALRLLLESPRFPKTDDVAKTDTDLQLFLLNQFGEYLDTPQDTGFIKLVLRRSNHLLETQTRVQIFDLIASQLSEKSNVMASLDIIEATISQDISLLQDYANTASGARLLKALLLLGDSEDELISQRAISASAAIHGTLDQDWNEKGISTLTSIIEEGLKEVSTTSLNIHVLSELACKTLSRQEMKGSPIAHKLLPDVEKWKESLEPFLLKRPNSQQAICDPMGGLVYLSKSDESPDSVQISRDGEGNSAAYRMALFFVNVLKNTELDDILDLNAIFEQMELLLLTSEIANNNINITGDNDLWNLYTSDTESEAVEFVAVVRNLIADYLGKSRSWWLGENSNDSSTREAITKRLVDSLKAKSAAGTAKSYYHVKCYAFIISHLIEIYGCPSHRVNEAEELMKAARKDGDIFTFTSICIAYKDTLTQSQVATRIFNEMVADASQPGTMKTASKAIGIMAAFNGMCSNQPDIKKSTAKQRIVILSKNLVSAMQDEDNLLLSSEICKALLEVLPPIADIYETLWGDLTNFLPSVWTNVFLTADDPKSWDTVPLLHSSLRLYGKLQALARAEETNDDLKDAWKGMEARLANELVLLLKKTAGIPDTGNLPLRIVNQLLSRHIRKTSLEGVEGFSELFPLLYVPSASVQQTAFEILHRAIPTAQEQISLDSALDKKQARLPDELLSLLLEPPDATLIEFDDFQHEDHLSLRSYLLSWLLVFDHVGNSSHKVKEDYVDNIKDGEYTTSLLDFMFDFLGFKRGKAIDITKIDVTTYVPETSESALKDIQWLLSHLYFLCLKFLPSVTKNWWLNCKPRQLNMTAETWTIKFFSVHVISEALATVGAWATKQGGAPDETLTIKVSQQAKEVTASYMVDEQRMAVVIRLPENYPLRQAIVEGVQRVAVEERKWQSWLISTQGVITFSNGNLVDGLISWRRNVIGALKGHTECAICYSIISVDKQLPTKRCSTCKNLFHSSCLFKWFKSSNASTCPLCRNPFNYG